MSDDTASQAARKPTPTNSTLLQGFEWNVPADGKHWSRLTGQVEALKAIGVNNVWIPPPCKAASPEGNGYDIYDLWDLGEFDQKGAVRTKWGSKEDLMALSKKSKDHDVGLYLDCVLNHKAGADSLEKCRVVEVDPNNRNKDTSEPFEINGWLGFDFKGRNNKYSEMQWHWYHFTGTDYNEETSKTAIYKILGDNKGWSQSVDSETGNADYMMYADIDYHHQEAVDETNKWGVWVTKELGLKGFRMDAVQHFSEVFTAQWVDTVRNECGQDIFIVGEFWIADAGTLSDWLGKMEHKFSLFDAPLVYNFSRISTSDGADLRSVLDGSLVQKEPINAVTLVVNHDTQPGQTMATKIEGFFKPLAYSIILFRNSGYPTVFYGDLYGTKGDEPEPPACGDKLADLVLARYLYAYGEQNDYFEEAHCIGFLRRGTWDKPDGMAVVMSNAGPGQRHMFVGEMHAGEKWTDILGWSTNEITIDEGGWADFTCPGVSVAVWVNSEAKGRDQFPVNFDSDIYKEK